MIYCRCCFSVYFIDKRNYFFYFKLALRSQTIRTWNNGKKSIDSLFSFSYFFAISFSLHFFCFAVFHVKKKEAQIDQFLSYLTLAHINIYPWKIQKRCVDDAIRDEGRMSTQIFNSAQLRSLNIQARIRLFPNRNRQHSNIDWQRNTIPSHIKIEDDEREVKNKTHGTSFEPFNTCTTVVHVQRQWWKMLTYVHVLLVWVCVSAVLMRQTARFVLRHMHECAMKAKQCKSGDCFCISFCAEDKPL